MLKTLFYLTLFSLCLGQLAALSKGTGVNVYAFDLCVFVFAFVGIAFFLISKSLYLPRIYLLFLVFCIFAAFTLIPNSTILSTENFIASSFYLVRFFMYLTAGLVVCNMLKSKLISYAEVGNAIIYSGLFLAFAGLIQLILLPDFTVLDSSLGWDPHKNRMASTFFDPNFLGGYFVICIALAFEKLRSKAAVKYYVFLAIFILSLILTFSRSSWLMLSIVILIYGVFKYRLLLVAFLIIAFLAYFAVPRIQTRLSGTTDPADSASFRLVSWEHAATIWQDNLLTGVGFNTYRYVQEKYGFIDESNVSVQNSGAGADSSLLLVLATTGLIGATLFVLAFKYVLFSKFSLLNASLLAGLFVHSLFINSLFYPQILFLWVVVFIGFSFDTQR